MGVLRFPWMRQPNQPTPIDRSNPITVGLIDAVTGKLFPPPEHKVLTKGAGAAFSKSSSKLGTLITQPNVENNGYVGYIGTTSDVDCELTILFIGVNSKVSGTNCAAVSNGMTAAIGSAGAGSMKVQWYGGWGDNGTSFAVDDNAPVVIVATFAPYTAGRVFVNRKLIATGSNMGGSKGTPESVTFGLPGMYTYSQITGGALVVGWRRILSDAEIIQVSTNPWQIFTPITLPFFPKIESASATWLIVPESSQQINRVSSQAISQVHKVAFTNSSQSNVSSAGNVKQTHKVVGQSSSQSNRASGGGVSQSSITFVAGSNSNQNSSTSSANVKQTHLVSGSSATVTDRANSAAISVTHLVRCADSTSVNRSSSGGVAQGSVTYVAGSNSTQVNRGNSTQIGQTHKVTGSNSASTIQTGQVAVRQTHRISCASSQQVAKGSTGGVSQSGTTFVAGSNSVGVNRGGTGNIKQVHLVRGSNSTGEIKSNQGQVNQVHRVTGSNSQQVVKSSTGGVSQSGTTFVVGSNSTVVTRCSSGQVKQTHLVRGSNSTLVTRCSAGRVSDGSNPTIGGVRVKHLGVTAEVVGAFVKYQGAYRPVRMFVKHNAVYRQVT